MWSNPFDTEIDEGELREEVSRKKAAPAQKAKKTPAVRSVKKVAAVGASTPTLRITTNVDSETDDEHIPCAQPKKRKRNQIFPDSEDELEPVRATALKNFISRRSGSGSAFQADHSRCGEYYIELRVYNSRELESRRLADKDRCKLALINIKTAVDGDTALWRSVSKVVTEVKEQFKGVRPVLYQSNI